MVPRRKAYDPPTLPTYMTQPNLTVPPSAHVRPCRPSTSEQLPAYRPPQPGIDVFSRDTGDGRGYSAAVATQIIRTSSTTAPPFPGSASSAPSDTSTGILLHTIPRRPVPSVRDITDSSPSYNAAITPFASSTEQGPPSRTSGLDEVGRSKSTREDGENQPPMYERVSARST